MLITLFFGLLISRILLIVLILFETLNNCIFISVSMLHFLNPRSSSITYTNVRESRERE